jgi:2,3-bisphosphoglycerate-dependent phosphoglycerate mutase
MRPRPPLLLVRHAQAEHHVLSITGGWSDTALTEKGHTQSILLADRLSRELNGKAIHLGSSDLRRAVQTATIIGQTLEVPPHLYPSLTDLNNGLAAGKTHTQARHIALPPTEPLFDWIPYPQAETWRQFFLRVTSFMISFSEAQTAPAILVTHAADIQVIVAWWLGLGLKSRSQFETLPASLTLLRMNRYGEPSLERLNDTAHLNENGLSDPLQF